MGAHLSGSQSCGTNNPKMLVMPNDTYAAKLSYFSPSPSASPRKHKGLHYSYKF